VEKSSPLFSAYLIEKLNNRLNIRLSGAEQFEVITGEAPGIPPGNERVNEKYSPHLCYPLIIRLRDKKMKIETEWRFGS
jgi:hypothetical protein